MTHELAGLAIGHARHPEHLTGCTVFLCPPGTVGSADYRGPAPGSREAALMSPDKPIDRPNAILLTGGSAFGLAAADGVMKALEEEGRGHPTPAGVVPIVPAAVIYDLLVGDAATRPTAEDGAAAFRAATTDTTLHGLVGAGTGATVSKWRGIAQPAGLGTAAVEVNGATVGALVVVNAMGDIISLEGEPLTGGPAVPGPLATPPPVGQNTTLVVVATDARADRAALGRLAVRAQDALAACLRPAHTSFDGDTCFAVSCGEHEVPLHDLAEAAFQAVGRAIEAVTAR